MWNSIAFLILPFTLSNAFAAVYRCKGHQEIRYLEVHLDGSSATDRGALCRALVALRSGNKLGRLTFQSIQDERVKLGSFRDLRLSDFKRMIKDLKLDLSSEDYSELREANSTTLEQLNENADGYQWANRAYINLSNTNSNNAATIVHEVNHVLNQSHIRFYKSQRDGLIEEYRAAFAETIFLGKHVVPNELKNQVIEDYNLHDVTADDVPDYPPGQIYPSAAAWDAD